MLAQEGGRPDSPAPTKWLILGIVCVFFVIMVRTAWVSDDAFITLRTVDNFVTGHGLRWNLGERVQAYTHPLWMFLLSAVYLLIQEPYFSALALGMLCSLGVVLFVGLRVARTPGHAVLVLALLTASRGFVDFATSGLENPLLHLLFCVFVWGLLVRPLGLRALALITALIMLTRMDAVLVALPPLAWATGETVRQHGWRRAALDLGVGFAPFALWELFSLFYYGVPFPNTAYAKLDTGLSTGRLMTQGFIYLLNTVSWDPGLLAICIAGIALGFGSRDRMQQALATGALLYIAYVLRVGGDFMVGRFLTLPLLVAACLIARTELGLLRPALLASLGLPFALLYVLPGATESWPVVADHKLSGVADERAFYRKEAGLMMFTRNGPFPDHSWRRGAEKYEDGRTYVVASAGFRGFYAGRKVHLIDKFALTDPLLARLPIPAGTFRVGHYARHVPRGYPETVQTGRCQMRSKPLCDYYAKLKLVVAGDLWSWERMVVIAKLNLGAYDSLRQAALAPREERAKLPASTDAR